MFPFASFQMLRSLHDTADCDLSFGNVLVQESCTFLEDKRRIFPTETQFIGRRNQFPTLPAGLQREVYLDLTTKN